VPEEIGTTSSGRDHDSCADFAKSVDDARADYIAVLGRETRVNGFSTAPTRV